MCVTGEGEELRGKKSDGNHTIATVCLNFCISFKLENIKSTIHAFILKWKAESAW